MKKLLIITYAFPPIPYSGTYRVLRLCKGLNALQYEVHVLTIAIDNRIPNDFELLERLPSNTHIHRSSIPDPWLRFQSWKNRQNPNSLPFTVLAKLINSLLRLLTIPDHQVLWIPFVTRSGLKVIDQHGIGTVLITAPPYSTLLSGPMLKKRKGVRFIADLRDPIVDNVAQVELLKPKGIYSKFMRKVHENVEKHIMKTADVIVANTETHKKELQSRYDSKQIFTVRNSFDPDDYRDIENNQFEKFTIAHMGAMYGLRKADRLFEAVDLIQQRNINRELNLEILFVGSINAELMKAAKAYNISRYVRHIPQVPHRKAMAYMLQSHLLLLVKATGDKSLGQIPAKFFEYLGTGHPILCIGPDQSEVACLIREFNLGYVVEDDAEQLAGILTSLMKNDSCQSNNTEAAALSEFNNSTMAKKIAALVG